MRQQASSPAPHQPGPPAVMHSTPFRTTRRLAPPRHPPARPLARRSPESAAVPLYPILMAQPCISAVPRAGWSCLDAGRLAVAKGHRGRFGGHARPAIPPAPVLCSARPLPWPADAQAGDGEGDLVHRPLRWAAFGSCGGDRAHVGGHMPPVVTCASGDQQRAIAGVGDRVRALGKGRCAACWTVHRSFPP
jgi:hypothetical protein